MPSASLSNKRLPVVAVVNRSDSTGGAAVVSRRLTAALRNLGCDARMLVEEKLSGLPYVVEACSPMRAKIPFLSERMEIFAANGFRRDTLFRIDTGSRGLPLWHHPVIREADVVCLNWVNQGMLSLKGVRKILELGKPVVWTMHDMWNLTGVCHHAGSCTGYLAHCGDCPLIGAPSGPHDISAKTFHHKDNLYRNAHVIGRFGENTLTFVAVSRWLASLASKSPLLGDMPVEVIPNAFPVDMFPAPNEVMAWRHGANRPEGEFVIAMGAARLDDPVKGLPLLLKALSLFKENNPELAARSRLLTFGNMRDPEAFAGIAIPHTHLGPLAGTKEVAEVLRGADAVISSSLYETLPGTLVEGQACGAIPVSFDRGGQADIIEHCHTGYLAHITGYDYDSASNLAKGIAWAATRDRDALAPILARNVADRFSSEAVASRYLALFNKILSRKD